LDEPFFLDIITAAAFNNNPKGKITTYDNVRGREVLRSKFATKTFIKVVNLLHWAAQNGYDVLVLGAWGCGAFYNPAIDIAKIFHEAISLYAGTIPEIKFAILGHNSSLRDTFSNHIQTEYSADPQAPLPLPFSNFLSVCEYGGSCNRVERDHKVAFHPPACPKGKECHLAQDNIHAVCRGHPQECPYWTQCLKYREKEHFE
jgi:hypothetical protein